MQAQSSEALLTTLESQVETQLAEVIRTFQNMTAETLAKPRADGGWSAAQCLWHLNSYGDHYLPAIEKELSRERFTANASFTSTFLGAWFTRLMQPGDKMKKMKAFKNHRPPSNVDPHKTVAEFILQQERLLGLLRSARKTDLNQVSISISIMPWFKMRLGDVFQFLIAHIERHLIQAEKVVRAQ